MIHLGSDLFLKKKKTFKGAIYPYGEMDEKDVSSCLYHLYSLKNI